MSIQLLALCGLMLESPITTRKDINEVDLGALSDISCLYYWKYMEYHVSIPRRL